MSEVKKTKKTKRKINRILTIILLVTILVLFSTLFYINIIPIIYVLLALFVTVALSFGIIILNFRRKRILRILGYFLSSLLIGIFVFIEIYLFNTLGFLLNMTSGNISLHNYNLVVLKDSEYEEIKDLKNELVGYSETIKSDELKKVFKKIQSKVKIEYKTYEDLNTLIEALLNNEVRGALLLDSELELLKEQNLEQFELLNIVDKFEIKKTIQDLKGAININKEPFNIYVSGIDTYGKITASSRSDVNMVLTINPKDEKILITWIPRDYYVNINNSKYKDKLTHAGIYGIDKSIYAVEKLLDTKMNYYVKVNFTSVIDLVDLLGGITVYNDETFTIENGHLYKEGELTLNGEEALGFVRERKNVTGGDLGRGRNQIKVLEAIINKAMSPSIIKKYNELLRKMNGAFITNMDQETIFSFIKRELRKRRNWQIESNTLTGIDSYELTYSYKNTELYVMKPDEEVVNKAISKIKAIMK